MMKMAVKKMASTRLAESKEPPMSTEKTKIQLRDRASRHLLRIVFLALTFFVVSEVISTRAVASDRSSASGAAQERTASGFNEALYPTVSAYIERTLKKMPDGYVCAISPSNASTRDCTRIGESRSDNISRTFGIFYKSSALSESGFLFIIDEHDGMFSVKESQPFKVEASTMRYGWGVENFVADSSDSFHFQTTSGSASMPDSDIFRFKLLNGQWILSGHDHKTLSRCPDESIDVGSSYSINFLTSKVRVEIRNDCKHVKTIERQLATPPLPWTSFDPSDSHLAPEAYGAVWH